MARPGTASQVGRDTAEASGGTRDALIWGAIVALQREGFSGASARVIARHAGCNQALVFYHFGSVANLLLAALDATSSRRMEQYASEVDGAADLGSLLRVARQIYREDLDAGRLSVLAEMIAGSSSTPGLGAEVSARVEPWIDFTEQVVRRTIEGTPIALVVPAADVAFGIVALYLGVELLTHLEGDNSRAESLFAAAERTAALLAGLFESPRPEAAGPA